MFNFKGIINNIIQDSSNDAEETDRKLAMRFIDSRAAVPLFIAVNKKTKMGYLYIMLEDKLSTDIYSNLPIWNGLAIEQCKTSIKIAGIHNQWFLVLHHQNESDHEIFEAIIENICNELLNLDTYDQMLPKLQRTLERWKNFFLTHGKEGLSSEAQQGLYGELWALRELLLSFKSNSIVDSWSGPEKDPHDFQHSDRALEVKTITSKKHYKVSINNEYQLDNRGYNHLFLIVLSLRKIDSGENLPEIIFNIRNIVRDEPYMLRRFNEKLFTVGYLGNHSPLYQKGYIHQDIFCYEIGEGFPRILSAALPHGIGGLKYTLELGACESFKVDFKDVISRFSFNKEIV